MLDTEQIKLLIIRDIAGELSPGQQAEVRSLIENNPELEALRNQLIEELSSPAAQKGLTDLRANFNLDVARETIESSEQKLQQTLKASRKLPLWTVSTAVAALLIIIAGIFWWRTSPVENKTIAAEASGSYVKLKLPNGQEVDLSNAGSKKVGTIQLNTSNQTLSYSLGTDGTKGTATLQVPDGKDFSVKLSDGTEIQLNSGSSLTFPFSFSEASREITISGEAYLKVAKMPAKPFRVRLKTAAATGSEMPTVQVLGTEFNVNTYNSSAVRVSLVEGSVKMSTPVDSLRIKPGQQALFRPGKKLQTERFDSDEVLSWRTGILEFRGTPLGDVIQDIPRWYGVPISIDDSSLKGKLFTGALDRKKPVSSFLEDLKYTHGVQYYNKDGVIHVTASGK